MATSTAVAELSAQMHASPAADSDRESTAEAEELPRTPLAWIEIESVTTGEFKQVVRVPFFRGQTIRIGRDANKCNLRFQNKAISPVHCEIYSVLFDKDERHPPLVYVRDCQSAAGTYVNGRLIGQEPYVTRAWLLENDDMVSVGPCTLRLRDYTVPSAGSALRALQRDEASMFSDQYTIKDVILGSGSFANVYLAVDVKTKQQVVCKVHDLASLRRHGESIVDRVDREVSIWSQLDHPNIVAFHRAFRTDNTMCVLLGPSLLAQSNEPRFTFGDLATGGDLFSLLERERTIPELEIKWIAVQLLRAVAYLHSKGVAHRDIKPENILCSASLHMHHRIVLADFGCAGVASLGRMTSHVGTALYRAPEALLPKKPHGMAVDIWSVGVLLLQLLSGDEPVGPLTQADQEVDMEELVLFVNLQRAGQENKPISQSGVDFIVACLNPDPRARPSAAEAAQHVWLRESADDVRLFQEREKQLTWKPRDIIIPAVVRLPREQPTVDSPTVDSPTVDSPTVDGPTTDRVQDSQGEEDARGQKHGGAAVPLLPQAAPAWHGRSKSLA